MNKLSEVYTHDLFTDFALDFLKENRDASFSLYLAYTLPRSDYEIPDTALYTDFCTPSPQRADEPHHGRAT